MNIIESIGKTPLVELTKVALKVQMPVYFLNLNFLIHWLV